MAGWYIRRGEKIVGPVELPKLQELAADGRVLPTDQLAKDMSGPWKEAGATTLFAPKQAPSALVPKAEAPPPAIIEAAEPPRTAAQKSMAVFAFVGRGMLTSGGAIKGFLSTRAQRKHEIRIAKIQAAALTDSKRPPAPQQRSAQPVAAAPIIHQTTVVKINNKNTAYGCSGCGTLLLLIIIGIVAFIIISSQNYK